jgi:DNA invertase Pin-like site-specific DNA recombinase
MTSQRLGYGRVSTLDQNLEAQADALTAAGANKLFIEKITGTKASRPELDKLREQMRHGDTLVITRLDRLGRSAKDLLSISSELEDNGVALEVLEQNINTTTPEGKLFFTLIAAFAEFEHSLMVARTKDGLAAARTRGRVGVGTQNSRIRKRRHEPPWVCWRTHAQTDEKSRLPRATLISQV